MVAGCKEERPLLLANGSGGSAESVQAPSRVRFVVIGLCFMSSAICYADRTNLSVALVAMREEFHWGPRTTGSLLAAFFFGYLFTQIPGGMLIARYGAHPTLLGGALVWSLLTIITPIFAHVSVRALFAIRVCVGLAEGVAIPATMSLVASWTPPMERSRANAITASGQFVGTVAAFSCAPLVDAWWPGIFYGFGCAGFVWALAFWLLCASHPQDHPRVNSAELRLITEAGGIEPMELVKCRSRAAIIMPTGRGGGGGDDAEAGANGGAIRPVFHRETGEAAGATAPPQLYPTCLRMLGEPAILCICAAHFSSNWGSYLLISWLPQLLTHLGLRLRSAAALFAAPYLCAALVDNVGGWVADEVLQRRLRWSRRSTRKAMQACAHGVQMVCFVALRATTRPTVATIFLTISISASSLSHSGYGANLIDVCGGSPGLTGLTMGVVNTVGTLPGIMANWATGRMLHADGSGWENVFTLVTAIYAVGLFLFLRYAEAHDVFADQGGAARGGASAAVAARRGGRTVYTRVSTGESEN